MSNENNVKNNDKQKNFQGKGKNPYDGTKPRLMNKKQVEEVACWVLRDKERWPFNDKLRLMTNELRGKATSKLVRDVVERYHW